MQVNILVSIRIVKIPGQENYLFFAMNLVDITPINVENHTFDNLTKRTRAVALDISIP